jgi:predicted nuclease of restriction endonuclease-like RecB superfamily
MNEKILELMELKSRYDTAKEEKYATDRREDAARRSFNGQLRSLIDGCVVQTDQVYIVNGKAVIFRKVQCEGNEREPQYDYSYEVLPVN